MNTLRIIAVSALIAVMIIAVGCTNDIRERAVLMLIGMVVAMLAVGLQIMRNEEAEDGEHHSHS